MVSNQSWDWDIGHKEIDISDWSQRFEWVEELYASPDGESVAAIVHVDEAFNVCINGTLWSEAPADKIWHLRFTPDNRPYALISDGGQWTVAISGETWSEGYDYAWNPMASADGTHLAVAVQQAGRYAMAVDGKAWESDFSDIGYFALSPSGRSTAAAVQVRSVDSGPGARLPGGHVQCGRGRQELGPDVCQCVARGVQSRRAPCGRRGAPQSI